jgi:hypothetical protein
MYGPHTPSAYWWKHFSAIAAASSSAALRASISRGVIGQISRLVKCADFAVIDDFGNIVVRVLGGKILKGDAPENLPCDYGGSVFIVGNEMMSQAHRHFSFGILA